VLRRIDVVFVCLCVGLAPVTVRAAEPVLEGRSGWSEEATAVAPVATMVSAPESLYNVNVKYLSCTGIDFTSSFAKLTDVGSFYVPTSGTTAIVTAHGRFGFATLITGSGALFEIRVDDQAPGLGYARPTVRENEVGLLPSVQNSATGVFSNLGAGSHMVSIWVKGGAGGSGTNAMIDPGCWSTDHLVIEFYEGAATQPINVSFASLPTFTQTSAKLADIGSFNLASSNSVVELTYNGRFAAASFEPASTGVVFEIRVDDELSPLGWAAAQIMASEADVYGKPIRINAVFPHLEAGNHTASIWVYGAWGGGSGAVINPGGWYDQLLVTEHEHVRATVLDFFWLPGVTFTETPTKVRDVGSFNVSDPSSIVELDFNGRLGAATINGSGAVFELRVDDLPVAIGRAKVPVKLQEASVFLDDVPASMTAFFTGLAPGSHTASLWVTGMHGGGDGAGSNRGGWDTDHLVVFEHGFNWIFMDDFESGNTLSWSTVIP
jgi:hypothetical protein